LKFWGSLRVRLYGLPDLPLDAKSRWSELVDDGITDRVPLSVVSVHTPEVFTLAPGSAVLLHATGAIVFDVPPGTARVAGWFGIREEAYTGPGRTAGVDFVVEGKWKDGRSTVLWHRFLNPLVEPTDRGR
jgi:hypothetical protein